MSLKKNKKLNSDFDSITISLASPESILAESRGEVLKPESHAVILKPSTIKKQFIESDNSVEYKTDGISISFQKKPFQIAYSFKGKPIISEKRGYVKNDSLETIQFNLTSLY